MKQIQKIKVQTPIFVQMMFLIALLPWIILFCYFTGKASAAPIDYSVCDKIYYDTFIWEVHPEFNKMCKNRFQYLTNQIKRSYITNQ